MKKMKDLVVNVENATVRVKGRVILDNLSLQIKRGDHHFILGANGAGKTTLVKMLMGFVWPLYGAKIEILGKLFGNYNLADLRRRIAWVSPFFQQWGNHDSTGLDLIISGVDGTLDLFRKPTDAEVEKAESIMRDLRCLHLRDQNLFTMSSGEQIKILIARAFMTDPDLVILDEPSVFLDITSREYLLREVSELAKRRDDITIIFITQRIEDIMPVFKHGFILSHGKIAASGSREEVITQENLLQAFGMPIDFTISKSGRYWPVIE